MDQRLFDYILAFPDHNLDVSYDELVGLEDIKDRLISETELLLNPAKLASWSISKYGKVIPLVKLFEKRYPLYIFAGDVGTGKTTLAESFGDHLAKKNNIHLSLFRLSLNTRGAGSVGDMTRLINQAFKVIADFTDQLKNGDGSYASAVILLIDEADALAQSRDMDNMQHEDRAGVNGIIQGIDTVAKSHIPVIIVMCTNRLSAIDPAVRRRAAAIFQFKRPNDVQREVLLKRYLDGTNLTDENYQELVKLTGPNESRDYGYTYSDFVQNLLPALVLETFPDKTVTLDGIRKLLERIPPTPPLKGLV